MSYELIDDNITLETVKKFFSEDGWKVLIDLYENTKRNVTWNCRKCNDRKLKNC